MVTNQNSGIGHWLQATIAERAILFAIIIGVYIMGVIAGVAAGVSYTGSARQELASYVQSVLTSLANQGAAPFNQLRSVFNKQILQTAGFLWLLGLSVLGAPLIAGVVFLRGFVLGFAAGFLSAQLAWKGVLLTFITLIPHNLLLIPGLVCAAVGATVFSIKALQLMLGRHQDEGIITHLGREGALALFGCILLIVGGLIEAYISPVATVMISRYLF